jgi:hypothetical protein
VRSSPVTSSCCASPASRSAPREPGLLGLPGGQVDDRGHGDADQHEQRDRGRVLRVRHVQRPDRGHEEEVQQQPTDQRGDDRGQQPAHQGRRHHDRQHQQGLDGQPAQPGRRRQQ